MVTHSLGRVVALALLLAACGGGGEEEAAAPDLAAVRARRDSVRKAAAADSIARVQFTACSDSVTAVLAKAAKGKKAGPPAPEGMIPPEVLKACGTPPAQAATAVAKAAVPDTGRPTAGGAQALTPQQQQVARADSIRQARERAKQDSMRAAQQRAGLDSAAQAQRDSVRQDSVRLANETQVLRESFTYTGGARDPFASLLTEDRSGPEFADLLLVGIYLDLRRSSNSVAVLRDKTTQKRYKLRVGDRLGRLQVAQIRQSDVVFTIEDIGFERQETLSLRKREATTP